MNLKKINEAGERQRKANQVYKRKLPNKDELIKNMANAANAVATACHFTECRSEEDLQRLRFHVAALWQYCAEHLGSFQMVINESHCADEISEFIEQTNKLVSSRVRECKESKQLPGVDDLIDDIVLGGHSAQRASIYTDVREMSEVKELYYYVDALMSYSKMYVKPLESVTDESLYDEVRRNEVSREEIRVESEWKAFWNENSQWGDHYQSVRIA